MPNLKINRALRQSRVGRFPASAAAMMERIPGEAVIALPSWALADLLDAMWDACQEAKGIANREAVANGCVWDASRQVMREMIAA